MSDSNQVPHDNWTASFHNQNLLPNKETNHTIVENDNAQENVLDALDEISKVNGDSVTNLKFHRVTSEISSNRFAQKTFKARKNGYCCLLKLID